MRLNIIFNDFIIIIIIILFKKIKFLFLSHGIWDLIPPPKDCKLGVVSEYLEHSYKLGPARQVDPVAGLVRVKQKTI
jgi:hypothetical protein